MVRFQNDAWRNVAKLPEPEVQNFILTGATSDEQFLPDTKTVAVLARELEHSIRPKVLDFGCGLGRNARHMIEAYPDWQVVGYDSPEMVARADEWLAKQGVKSDRLRLVSDWESLKAERFDAVIAMLVFQHIYKDELDGYLQDLTQMTNLLLVQGRRFNDDQTEPIRPNTWKLIAKHWCLVSASELFKFDGDPEDHNWTIWMPAAKGA